MSPALRTPRASWPAPRCPGGRGGAGSSEHNLWNVARQAAVVLSLSAAAACGSMDAEAAAGVDESLALDGSAASMDELGAAVLEALVTGDSARLEELRLSEFEHNEVVWPELPASAPEVNFPVDYAWENIRNRNRRGLTRLMPLFATRDVTFQDVECRGETEAFETFQVETDCWVIFTDRERDGRWEVQAFKDALSRGGGLKIFRFYDEEPRAYRHAAER